MLQHHITTSYLLTLVLFSLYIASIGMAFYTRGVAFAGVAWLRSDIHEMYQMAFALAFFFISFFIFSISCVFLWFLGGIYV